MESQSISQGINQSNSKNVKGFKANTVDEILHHLTGWISHYLQSFILYILGGCLGCLPSTDPENSHTIWCLFDPPFAIGYFPSLRRQIYIYIRSISKDSSHQPPKNKRSLNYCWAKMSWQPPLSSQTLLEKKHLLQVNWQLAGMAGPFDWADVFSYCYGSLPKGRDNKLVNHQPAPISWH